MSATDAEQVFDALKRILRNKGLTYAQVGRQIGLSESAVKKIFSKRDCSLARLSQLARAAGLGLGELCALAERPGFERVRLDDRQQRWLLTHPEQLWLYWKLSADRLRPDEIRARWQLEPAWMTRSLAQLDRMGLVESGPGERVALPHGDLVRWVDEGPLLQRLNRSWSGALVEDAQRARDRESLRLHELQLLPETADELRSALRALADEFLRRARREQASTRQRDRCTLRLLVALAEGSFVQGGPEKMRLAPP